MRTEFRDVNVDVALLKHNPNIWFIQVSCLSSAHIRKFWILKTSSQNNQIEHVACCLSKSGNLFNLQQQLHRQVVAFDSS